jgi:hypothetical protein
LGNSPPGQSPWYPKIIPHCDTTYALDRLFVCLMVFNATFNNISVISWRSVLLVEDPEKTTDLSQVTDKLYHIKLYTSPWSRFELTTSLVIGTDCIGSCKSNYHTITLTCTAILWFMCLSGTDSGRNMWQLYRWGITDLYHNSMIDAQWQSLIFHGYGSPWDHPIMSIKHY